VRERVRAARGYDGPREWVLTAALGEAARGPATRRREIGGGERDNIFYSMHTRVRATPGVEDRTATR
jgi:hypothetical protein